MLVRLGTTTLMSRTTMKTTTATTTATATTTTATKTTTKMFLVFALLLTQGCSPLESMYTDHVTMQLEYSHPDDLAEILQEVKRVAKTCSLLDDYTVQGLNPTQFLT